MNEGISPPDYSAIKPHLLRLSGGGESHGGIVTERVVEAAFADDLHDTSGPHSDVIVIPTRRPSRIDWKADGRHRSALMAPGEIIVNPKSNFVAPRWHKPTEFLLLSLNRSFFSPQNTGIDWQSIVIDPRFHFRDDLLRSLAEALIANQGGTEPPDVLYAETLSQALAVHLSKKYGAKPPKAAGRGLAPPKLRIIEEFIQESLANEIRLDALAALAGMSHSHFVTLFRASTGLSPHRYVTMKRLERAKNLLTHTSLPIAEIALCCGFCDQSHLSRVMRRHTGMTPRHYRG